MRQCNGCTLCCYVGGVSELEKPPHTSCVHVTEYGCGIFGSKERPQTCNSFKCAWLHDIGGEKDRPDKIGVLLSINTTPRGLIGFAIETMPGAIETTGGNAIVDFARKTKLPIIAVKYESRPPNDIGDWVIAHTDIEEKCFAIIDRTYVRILADDVTLFNRKEP